MPDSLRQLARIAARVGLAAATRYAIARVTTLPALLRTIATLKQTRDLQRATRLVTRRTFGPAQAVYAMQMESELSGLLGYCQSAQPQTIVEIGTAAGGTLLLLCLLAADDGLIVSIDLPRGAFGGGYGRWRSPVYRSFTRRAQRLHLLRRDSHDPATIEELRRLLGGRPVDLLFIDGDHTLPGVAADYAAYGTLVRPGGLIALHDIVSDPRQPSMQVHLFWRQLLLNQEAATEFVHDPNRQHGYGIGLLVKPPASQ